MDEGNRAMNIIDRIGKKQIDNVLGQRELPEFAPGDTLRVDVKVIEGTRERIQAFEGVCIARKSKGVNSSFTVRKISYGEGVERVFPIYSPLVDSIEVVRRGRVRRAKLYYLRGLTGKAARITERRTARKVAENVAVDAQPAQEESQVDTAEATTTDSGAE